MLLADIADFLLQTLAVIIGVTLLARVYMTYLGMPARNPLAQFSIALTDWLVRPLRRLVPGAGRFDAATLLAALLVALVFLAPIVVEDLRTRRLLGRSRVRVVRNLGLGCLACRRCLVRLT